MFEESPLFEYTNHQYRNAELEESPATRCRCSLPQPCEASYLPMRSVHHVGVPTAHCGCGGSFNADAMPMPMQLLQCMQSTHSTNALPYDALSTTRA